MGGIVDFGKSLLFGPDMPDAGATAANQAEINKQAIYDSAAVNQINQLGPGYDINWSGEIGSPDRTMSYELDPWREALAQQMGMFALDQSAMLGGPIDYSGVTPIPGYDDFGQRASEVEETMYNSLMSRVMPEMERKWDMDLTLMGAKGIPVGGEAWNDESESMARQWQDLTLGAAGQAIGLGQQESDRLFGQQMAAHQQGMSNIGFDRQAVANELAMMLNANPYNQAQIQTPTQYQVAPADYMGMEMANAQNQAANQSSMTGGLASLGSAWILGSMLSDRRLKENIERIGTTEGGVPTYSFNYKGSPARHVGVMAQDLLFTQPDAVHTDPDGIMSVDYSRVR